MTGRTKRILLSLAAGWILFGLVLPNMAGASPLSLSPADESLLAKTLAEECPDVTYAARVGMAAAVIGRMESPRHPDSLNAVLAELDREGAFGEVPAERADASPSGPPYRDALRRLLAGLGGFIRNQSGQRNEARLLELSLHAVRAAEAGADPVGGALSFRVIPPSGTPDFLFNDAAEDTDSRRIRDALRDYPVTVGGVGFR